MSNADFGNNEEETRGDEEGGKQGRGGGAFGVIEGIYERVTKLIFSFW